MNRWKAATKRYGNKFGRFYKREPEALINLHGLMNSSAPNRINLLYYFIPLKKGLG